MPRPIDVKSSYYPGLDGLRSLAVTLVILYHLGFAQFSGGLLGVGVFFTLSGFLITGVLVRRWERRDGAQLVGFWIARFRRLLPAVVLLLIVNMLLVILLDPKQLATRSMQALSALFYVANWHTIVAAQSYFNRFAKTGPFDHLWSLSVEEQFYLVWPLLLLGLMRLTGRRKRLVALLTLVLAAGSFVLLALLANPGFDNTRAYEGTDTRAGGLLVGAALALWWRPRAMPQRSQPGEPASRAYPGPVIDVVGFLGVAGIIALSVTTNEYSLSIYHWGLLALAVSTGAVIVAVCTPGSLASRFFGWTPLRWLGERSYGIYLWHLPVLVFTPETFLPSWPWLRMPLQVGLSVGLAAASWRWVEDPIRRHGLRASFRKAFGPGSAAGQPGVGFGALLVALSCLASLLAMRTIQIDSPQPAKPAPPSPSTSSATSTPSPDNTPSSSPPPASPSKSTPPPKPVTTTCEQVVYIGDSTSEGLISTDYLPDPGDRIDAQLKKVGVKTFHPDISGARSIIETWHDLPNAQTAASTYLNQGFKGCWILALGTNDAANFYAGGADYPTRIDLMMNLIPQDQPVMWVNVKTLVKTGYYSNQHSIEWDNTLVAEAKKYSNMRVYGWADEVADAWYIDDGIHFTTPGYRERSRRIAKALVNAFPAGGPKSSETVVHS